MHNKSHYTALIIACVLLLVSYSPLSSAQNVLVIWGADKSQPWTQEVALSLNRAVKDASQPITLYEESLHYNRLKKLPEARVWSALLNDKYADANIDLVLAFEHTASKQLELAFDDLLPNARKFSILGNGKLPKVVSSGADLTLANHMDDVKQLLPELEQHLVITSLPLIKNEFNTLDINGQTTTLATDALSYQQLFERIDKLPANSAITYAVMHKDARGESRNPRAVLEEILERAKSPVFVKHSTLLIPGVVGGHTLDAEKVAQLMVTSMQTAMPNRPPLHIGTLKLDAQALAHWGIPSANLPSDARLYNIKPSFWENYQAQLYWTLAALAAAIVALLLLSFVLRKRNEHLVLVELQKETSERLKVAAEESLAREREYGQSQRMAQLAVEAANIGTFRYNPKTDQIWLSPTAARILDLEPGEEGCVSGIGKLLSSRILPEDFDKLSTTYDSGPDSRAELTYRIVTGDGELRWISSVSEVNPLDGNDTRIGVLRDLTDERVLTDKLLRSQERMTLALDSARIDLFEIEVSSGTALPLSTGRGLFQLGQKFDFVNGISNLSLPTETRLEINTVIRQEERRFEFTEQRVDGTKQRWIQLVTGRFYHRDGIKYLTLSYTDITHLRKQQHQIEQHALENELALSASGAGMVRIQPKTGRTWMSPQAQAIWDTGPLAGDTTSLSALAEKHHPEDDEHVRAEFHKMLTGRDIGAQEYRIRLSSGKYRWIRAYGKTRYDMSGVAEVIAVFYDIDNEKQQLRELEDSRERQSRLFAIIGHELRTPIATLQMMLEEQGVFELKPFGKQTQETMKHTLSVLDDLRSVTQPQARQSRETPASAYDQLEQTLGSLAGLLQRHKIRPHFFSNPEAQTLCLFDRQALRQMTTNLIKNACLHSGASDVWLTIEATPQADRLNLRVSISDNGKGIPAQQIETLFEAFRRGDTNADGTGLGLHICRDLAQRMGGTLTCEKSTQGGARFTFTGSFKRASSEHPVKHTEQPSLTSLSGMRVLYAEDQKTLQLLTSTLLKKQGAEVCVANDGSHALELYEPNKYDLVLTDIMMPNMDGYGLTQALRERGYTGKIIGLTAATIGQETERLLALGADATLSKPIDIHKLCTLAQDTERA